jgi:hypothetical protein
MEKLLEEILAESRFQTALLEKLVRLSDSREAQTTEAKEALRKVAEAFKGTPFESIISAAMKGGKVCGQ